jgi:hypothetical protein
VLPEGNKGMNNPNIKPLCNVYPTIKKRIKILNIGHKHKFLYYDIFFDKEIKKPVKNTGCRWRKAKNLLRLI